MAGYAHLQLAQHGGIVVARLHRPEQRNALNPKLIAELTDFARAHRTRSDLRAVVLAGAPDFFSAGADLDSAGASAAEPPTLLQLRELITAGPDMCQAWEDIEVPTIVAVEGWCVGGACALALACDFRICGAGGRMRLPEVPLGINMSWRSLPRLTTLVGPARAKRFTMFGEFADAQTMLDWGMVDAVVEAGGAEAAAMEWARRLEALPPLPIRMTKEAINATANANHHATSYMDRDQFLLTFLSSDFREGTQAFFDKRKPDFKGN